MKSSNIEQGVTQDLHHDSVQLPLSSQHIKPVDSMTLSQKLYQCKVIEIAAEYEQATEADSLEKMKNLLNKLVGLGD